MKCRDGALACVLLFPLLSVVAADDKKEPPEAKALRDTIAARRKMGLNSPDVAP